MEQEKIERKEAREIRYMEKAQRIELLKKE